MKKQLLILGLLSMGAIGANAQCAPDVTNPVASCQNVTVYLDASGNVTVPASAVDGGSTDNCVLAGVFFILPPQLVMTGTQGDAIYTANLDGTGMSLMYPSLGTGGAGPVGIEYEPTNNLIYVPGGNDHEIYTADAFGSGITGTLANASGVGSEHHDVEIDAANNRMFFTTSGGGLWTGNMDGSGTATQIATANSNITGVEYDALNDKVIYVDLANEIISINPDGTGAVVLYDGADGLSGARQIAIDPAQNKIWWANRDTDEIMTGSLDGVAAATVMWTGQSGLYGMHHDVVTGLLFWATFGGNDEIHVSADDGTGSVSTVISGSYGSFRDVTVARSTTPLASLDFSCSDVGVNTVEFIAADASGNLASCSATITVVDTISPTAVCQNGTVYLDETGNATSQPNKIYFTNNNNNEIYSVNPDGSNMTLLTSNATPTGSGPIGVYYHDGNLYYGGGNNSNVYTISSTGSASGAGMSNAGPNNSNYHDVVIDAPNNRYFYTNSFNGLYVANFDGTGSETQLAAAGGAITGLDYDPIADKVYYVDQGDSEVRVMNGDGTSNTLLYDNADGITSPRQITIDVAGNRLFVSNFGNDEIIEGSLDGVATASIVWASQNNCYGIDYDGLSDNLYWTSTASGELYSGKADGTGSVAVIVTGQNGIRGVDRANNSGPIVTDGGSSDNCGIVTTSTDISTFSCSDIGSPITVVTTFTDGAGNTSSCSSDITVVDTLGPNIDCLADINVVTDNAGCTAIVNWTAPTMADNCGGGIVSNSSHNPGDVFNLGTTTVLYTAVDGTGNQTSCSFDVIVTNDLAATFTQTDVLCFGDTTGIADVTVTGGATAYTFDWDNDGTGDFDDAEDLTNIGIGTYNLVVNDANGCSVNGSVTITGPATAVDVALNTLTAASCGASDGAIDIDVTGGTPTYIFDWDNDGTGDNDDTEDLSGLPVGTYTVIAIDANGCADTASFTIVNPGAATLAETHVNTTCYNDADGSIDLTVTGGNPGFTFDWDNDGTGDNDDTEDLTGLTAGTYSVTVTDASSCVSVLNVTISQPDSLMLFAASTPEVPGNLDGAINLTVTGGTAPYLFDWDNDGTGDTDDTEDLSGLAAGTYIVAVIDASGCANSLTVVVAVGSGVGIETTETNAFTVYPNPTDGLVTIQFVTAPINASLNLVSVDGKVIQSVSINSDIMNFDLSGMERGVYFIEVIGEDYKNTSRIVLK